MSKCNANTKSITRSIYLEVQSEDPQVIQEHYQSLREEMTRILPEGHPVQLTLLWEYVIRMKQFPSNVDPKLVFHEILERLKDPEWQVRQHALRVLIDIFPTLSADVIDANMQLIVSELVSNLGHPTPAVRKGSLDALRIYLLHGNDNNRIVQNIFTELNREELNDFRTNVKIGIILSIPLLLYPSKKSEGPSRDVLKQITLALTDRLVDVMYQKAAVRTLMKIKNIVGNDEFHSYFGAVNDEMKSHFDILCNAYNLNSPKCSTKDENKVAGLSQSLVPISKNQMKTENEDRFENSQPEETNKSLIPPSRVLLETEIKFDKNSAITMSLLEEKKYKETDKLENKKDEEPSIIKPSLKEKPKISRRVHFGGEEIKLRTPESEDSDSFLSKDYPQSRIPLPLSPATKIPRYRKSLMNLNTCDDFIWKSFVSSLNGSKKSDSHIHDSSLNPKKGILCCNSASNKSLSHQNVIHSPKREVMKKNEVDTSVDEVDYNQKITLDDVPAGSFKIFSEKKNGDCHLEEANFDYFSHDRSGVRKNRKSLSATVIAETEKSYERKSEKTGKNQGSLLDRKMSEKKSEDGKIEVKGNQKTNKKELTRNKSAEKLADAAPSSKKVDYCVLREMKNSNEHWIQDNLNGQNFEILQDDNIGNLTPLSRRKSELIKSDIFKQPNHDEYSYLESHEDTDFDLHIW